MDQPPPSALAITGWIVGVISLLGLVIRQIGPWRKQITETEEKLRTELGERLKFEREQHNTERSALISRLDKIERILNKERILHNSERALDRHRLNNIQQCFDAMILLIETSPENAPVVVTRIKELRKVQMIAEAEEKAKIRAAEIAADDCETNHDRN